MFNSVVNNNGTTEQQMTKEPLCVATGAANNNITEFMNK
jgi:hypothetical protein